jgi:hypothetical protein
LERIFAKMLFEIGRGRTIWTLIILVHLYLFWHWRRAQSKGWLSLTWLLIFFLGSALSFFTDDGLVERVMDGTGYLYAHLYQGLWRTDAAALQGMLARWQSVWLPLYAQWLGIWLLGLLLIKWSRTIKQRLIH